jgi:hypothetical protein
VSDDAVRRFPIRYSIQRWKDNIWSLGGILIILLAFTVGKLVLGQPMGDLILPLLIVDALLLALFWLMRVFSYVELRGETVRVRYITRDLTLPMTSLARVRRQPLEVAFQPAERRRYVNRFVRRLAREPAAYIRIDKRQEALLQQAEQKLGPRLVAGPDIVVPILAVDEFVGIMKGRLRGEGKG